MSESGTRDGLVVVRGDADGFAQEIRTKLH
jgi:hypothetical protein